MIEIPRNSRFDDARRFADHYRTMLSQADCNYFDSRSRRTLKRPSLTYKRNIRRAEYLYTFGGTTKAKLRTSYECVYMILKVSRTNLAAADI